MSSTANKTFQKFYNLEDMILFVQRRAKELNSFKMNERKSIPHRLISDLSRVGIFGVQIPEEYSGLGWPLRSVLRLVEQIAAIDVGLSAFLVLHYTSTLPILSHAQPELRTRLLPELAAGRALTSLALTEPAAGSNPRAMTTSFRPIDIGGYIIHGEKTWIGNAELASNIICFARGFDGRISAFLIDADSPGLIVKSEIESLGLKAMPQNPIIFDGVGVSPDRLLGQEGNGLGVADEALTFGRLATGAMVLGGIRRCAQIMGRFADRRVVNTGRLRDNGVTRKRMAEVHGAIAAIDGLLELILCEQASGHALPSEVSMLLKIGASELLGQIADSTLQLLGSRGYAEKNGVASLFRDARFLRIGEGPTETLRVQVGAAIAHKEPTLHGFFARNGDTSVLAPLMELAANSVAEESLQHREVFYDRLGEVALWTLFHLATKRIGHVDEVVEGWIKERLGAALHSARPDPVIVEPDGWDDLIATCDDAIGSLDQSWPFPQQARDPYLRNIFDTHSSPDPIGPKEAKMPSEPGPGLNLSVLTNNCHHAEERSTVWTPDSPLSPALFEALEETAGKFGIEPEDLLFSTYTAFLARLADASEIELTRIWISDGASGRNLLRIKIEENASIEAITRYAGEALRSARPGEGNVVSAPRTLRLSYDKPTDRGLLSAAFVSMADEAVALVEGLFDSADLALVCKRLDLPLVLKWRYNSALLEAGTVERRHANFETFLASALAQPSADTRKLDILSDGERSLVIDHYNGSMTHPAYYQHTIHRLIEQQIDSTPDAVAIETPDERLTFRLLESRSNRLAHCLLSKGLKRGEMVAIMTSRSPSMVIGLLAVLKLGGQFAIINGSHPSDRRAWLIGEAKARFVIVDSTMVDDVPECGAEVLIEGLQDSYSDARVSIDVEPKDIAYVVFTSGSTGKPKGAMISHQAIVNQLLARRDMLGLRQDERVLQAAAPNFDIVVWELLGPLVFGGSIVMSGTGDFNWDPARVWQLIEDHKITVIQIVPSQLSLLLDKFQNGTGASLRHVICGGETLSSNLHERFFAVCTAHLYNFYGPTEGAIDSTWWRCEPGSDSPSAPIGRAISNRRLYVVDRYGAPVPFGIPGELLIGGVGVADGYLGKPELTAECFLSDPFINDPGARMYRTGDLVRYGAHGVLEFLGRIDRQIKIRGVRIEPEEVEVVISDNPSVSLCAVVVRETPAGDKRLVAYVTIAKSGECSCRDLQAHARQNLPLEMVPSAFVILDKLPLTATGKVDTRNLPPVDWEALSGEEVRPLEGAVEIALASIWSDVLGVIIIDAGMNFFELGGHSLTAVQVISRITDTFGVEFSIGDFFGSPVLHAQASRIAAACSECIDPGKVKADTEPMAPLSYSQESLWFLHRMGDAGAYNEFAGVHLEGPLKVDALQRAIHNLLARHDSLRTVLSIEDGTARQVVRPLCDFVLAMQDLSSYPADSLEQCVSDRAQKEANLPFDLETGPLAQFKLLKLSINSHVLLIKIHHVCGDGWSLGVISKDLEAFYKAEVSGQPPDLQPVKMQYAEYARQQRVELGGDRLKKGVSWWMQRLADLPPLLDLAFDRKRAPVQRFIGARQSFDLGAELSGKIRDLGKRLGVTPYVITLTAFAILLQRYSRMEEFTIGSPFANRVRRVLENMVGFVANTVVLRADLSGDQTVKSLLARFMKTVLEAHEYADIPFAKIVEALRPTRDLSHNPVFQVMFSWQSGCSLSDMNLPDLIIRPFEVHADRAKFDINLVAADAADGVIRGRWEYDTDLFDKETIYRMIEQFRMILQQMVQNPNMPVREIALLSEEERTQLSTYWAARKDFPEGRTLVDLFAEQVACRPDAQALVAGEDVLSYRELDSQARALASYLAERGVGPERRVGIFMDRSADMVVAILGVLFAGAAYVPIDPSSPPDRVSTIISDAEVTAFLVQSRLVERFSPANIPVVVLDRERAAIRATPPIAASRAGALNVAYVIYTSGSTGKPKGVQIEHRQVVRLFAATDQWFKFGPEDIWTLFHSFAFDFSVWEIWGALLKGGKLVIVPYSVCRSPGDFYRFLVDHRVTVLNQTPSAFQQLNQAEASLGPDSQLALRYVIFGGEALDFATLAPWFKRHGDQAPQLVNMYGITETTVHVTYRPIRQTDMQSGGGSMIGEPIPDLELLILDELLRPVPVGIPGELFVGGAGLARGYLNRPELNAERFITHPFAPERRLYRSGDLVRFLRNRDIEYLGRIDHQVQLRGFRIELGEIEARVKELPGALDATCIIREDISDDKRLVVYFIAEEGRVDTEVLRTHLADKLPSYMIPSALIRLDRFTLTVNGKIDRRALPKPDYSGSGGSVPRNETEAALLDVWKELLGSETIGIRDNFFDLGGHSLLSVKLLSSVSSRFGWSVPLAAFFAAPTIEGMAEAIAAGRSEFASCITLRGGEMPEPFFCFPGSGGMIQTLDGLAKQTSSRHPFIAVQRPGLGGTELPLRTVNDIAEISIKGILKLQSKGPYYFGGHSFGAWIAYEVARRLSAAGNEIACLAVLDMPAPSAVQLGRIGEPERLLETLTEIIRTVYGDQLPTLLTEQLISASPKKRVELLSHALASSDFLSTCGGHEYVRDILRVLEADEEAMAAYHMAGSEASPMPIVLFASSESWDGNRGLQTDVSDPSLGWQRLTNSDVAVVPIAGDHGTMLTAPHVGELARQLDKHLT